MTGYVASSSGFTDQATVVNGASDFSYEIWIFPNLQLPLLENAHRLIHIHHNTSGVLAKINQTLAEHKTNIVGQYLKTNELIGYVITDIDKAYNKEVVDDLKAIDGTIRFRVLY